MRQTLLFFFFQEEDVPTITIIATQNFNIYKSNNNTYIFFDIGFLKNKPQPTRNHHQQPIKY